MAVRAVPSKRSPGLRFHWWWILLIVGVLLVAGVFAFAIFKPIKVLPRMRLAPGFTLIDQNGQRLTSEDLRGQVVLFNFLYTGCGAQCDQMNATMQEVQQRLGEVALGGLPVQFITISFDPAHDTPEALARYAESLGADTSQWRFATGDPARLKEMIGGGFGVYYAPDEEGGFQFDPTFVLMDGWGIIRGKYRYQVQVSDPDRILRHFGVLAEEVQKATGANKLIYEAAHLFLCYSP
ncbi:MAG TPA: SCO family protein [Anaerolineae bacterium]|nr:SCO family protein [Anaerolineae bacterium]HNU03100.1 SCO family protein [Anaerolineae bacterium]